MKLFDYNYSKYWKKAGKSYKDNFKHTDSFEIQEIVLLDYLKTLKFNSVFEFGCGFGRVTQILKDNFEIDTYDAIDISEHQIKHCDVKDVNFQVADFVDYTPTRKYDLVIASEVLMHIPPEMIDQTIKKLVGMSQKYMVSIDVYGYKGKLAKHNFIHNYEMIYSSYGKCDVIDIKNDQSLFGVDIK